MRERKSIRLMYQFFFSLFFRIEFFCFFFFTLLVWVSKSPTIQQLSSTIINDNPDDDDDDDDDGMGKIFFLLFVKVFFPVFSRISLIHSMKREKKIQTCSCWALVFFLISVHSIQRIMARIDGDFQWINSLVDEPAGVFFSRYSICSFLHSNKKNKNFP